jgi:hypothetical protein
MDLSTVLEGDALTPLLERCRTRPCRGRLARRAGARRLARVRGRRAPGEVEALLGYLVAVRRSAALQVPLPAKARFYRNADMEWSFLLREAPGGGQPGAGRRRPPVRQDRHRGLPRQRPGVPRQGVQEDLRPLPAAASAGREDLRLPRG